MDQKEIKYLPFPFRWEKDVTLQSVMDTAKAVLERPSPLTTSDTGSRIGERLPLCTTSRQSATSCNSQSSGWIQLDPAVDRFTMKLHQERKAFFLKSIQAKTENGFKPGLPKFDAVDPDVRNVSF